MFGGETKGLGLPTGLQAGIPSPGDKKYAVGQEELFRREVEVLVKGVEGSSPAEFGLAVLTSVTDMAAKNKTTMWLSTKDLSPEGHKLSSEAEILLFNQRRVMGQTAEFQSYARKIAQIGRSSLAASMASLEFIPGRIFKSALQMVVPDHVLDVFNLGQTTFDFPIGGSSVWAPGASAPRPDRDVDIENARKEIRDNDKADVMALMDAKFKMMEHYFVIRDQLQGVIDVFPDFARVLAYLAGPSWDNRVPIAQFMATKCRTADAATMMANGAFLTELMGHWKRVHNHLTTEGRPPKAVPLQVTVSSKAAKTAFERTLIDCKNLYNLTNIPKPTSLSSGGVALWFTKETTQWIEEKQRSQLVKTVDKIMKADLSAANVQDSEVAKAAKHRFAAFVLRCMISTLYDPAIGVAGNLLRLEQLLTEEDYARVAWAMVAVSKEVKLAAEEKVGLPP